MFSWIGSECNAMLLDMPNHLLRYRAWLWRALVRVSGDNSEGKGVEIVDVGAIFLDI
jgi:hypothetical protein